MTRVSATPHSLNIIWKETEVLLFSKRYMKHKQPEFLVWTVSQNHSQKRWILDQVDCFTWKKNNNIISAKSSMNQFNSCHWSLSNCPHSLRPKTQKALIHFVSINTLNCNPQNSRTVNQVYLIVSLSHAHISSIKDSHLKKKKKKSYQTTVTLFK